MPQLPTLVASLRDRLPRLPSRRPRAAEAWSWAPQQLYPAPSAGAPVARRGLRLSDRWRLAFVLGSVLLAYQYSLRTLLSTLSLDSPLAYLGLVPFMALALALLRGAPRPDEPDIHDRQVDVIVGVPLMAGALAVMTLLPGRMSTMFWYDRIDLLSMPLFVAGAIALAFGVRTLGRVRVAVAFLLLAWPVPYTYLLDRGLTKFTGLTLSALHAVVRHVHVASPIAGSDGSLFSLGHGLHAFTVSVASACSGVDGFVGFLLVGLAFLHLSKGKRSRKALWLLFGLALVYALNLGRLLLVFWVGSTWGQRVAIDGLHPYIGLVLFSVGVALMALSAPLFGLELETRSRRTAPRRGGRGGSGPGGGTAVASLATAPTLRLAAAGLALAAVVAGMADSGLQRFQLVADNLGTTSIDSFLTSPPQLAGWHEARIAQYDWATRFFGHGSSWIRYEYYGSQAPVPVVTDVVTTSSLSRLQAYNVQACYEFHGFGLHKPISYSLGGGVEGTLLTFHDPKMVGNWNALFWVWAVNTPQGRRYERVVLLAPVNGAYLAAQGRSVAATAMFQAQRTNPSTQLLHASQAWLAGFAKQLVKARTDAAKAPHPATTTAAAR